MKIIITVLLIITIFGCQGKSPTDAGAPENKQQSSMPPAPPAGPNPTAASPSAGPSGISVTGTVLEKIDVDNGMYLRLKTPKGEIWAAVNKASVKKGANVTIVNAMPMDGFESKTLHRKFDHILFGSISTGSGPTASTPPPTPGNGMPENTPGTMAAQHAAVANAPADTGEIKVTKAEGGEGKMVAEIFAAKASLKDATVAVRGKVVKYNAGIMGKNWIHLRDGSGSRENMNLDITVTTADSAAVGDIVLVRGTVHLNRDFGAGYTYPVIIEDAKVTK